LTIFEKAELKLGGQAPKVNNTRANLKTKIFVIVANLKNRKKQRKHGNDELRNRKSILKKYKRRKKNEFRIQCFI